NVPVNPVTGTANLRQNFPVLTAVVASSASRDSERGLNPNAPVSPNSDLTVTGTLHSAPNTTYMINWYYSSDAQCVANEEGSRPLASGKIPGVATDANGDATFNIPFDFPPGQTSGVINTTATDPNGNTSEYSSCQTVAAPVQVTVQTNPTGRTFTIDGTS